MKQVDEVRLIPISAVAVVSSRARNRQRFMELTESVASVGLKRPITVRKGKAADSYELVCGEGRLKAFRALGQKEIPAILVKATSSECLLMGLVENLARGQHSSLELLGEVGRLANAGYTIDQVASKLGFSAGYVRDICYLLKHGEERLLRAIQNKIIPHTTAVEIAKANSGAVRKALLETYLQKPHTSKQIVDIRHLIEQRLVNGKGSNPGKKRSRKVAATSSALTRAYRREGERQNLVSRKAELTHARLVFVISALRSLLSEKLFVRILREESLNIMPLQLQRRLATEA
jgi:ParB family transcriptional regulator, chromosome partitioning protein